MIDSWKSPLTSMGWSHISWRWGRQKGDEGTSGAWFDGKWKEKHLCQMGLVSLVSGEAMTFMKGFQTNNKQASQDLLLPLCFLTPLSWDGHEGHCRVRNGGGSPGYDARSQGLVSQNITGHQQWCLCDCTESAVYFSYLHCALGTGMVLLTMPRKEALGTECLRRLLWCPHMSRNPYNWEELEG